MPAEVCITASYAFFPLAERDLIALQEELNMFGKRHEMKGLVLLAPEGINSTVCGTMEATLEWKKRMRALQSGMLFKDSRAEQMVFRRWLVKRKPELITFKQQRTTPAGTHHHLSPREWKQMMERGDALVIDARNAYETAIGTFRGAVDLKINRFQDFPEAVRSAAIPKEKPVMLYCTGGIRCEKAVLSMEEQGYTNVYQLEGGILAYMEQYPHDAFVGECFVFDDRVALDQHLRPSATYRFCGECGDPTEAVVCGGCDTKLHEKGHE